MTTIKNDLVNETFFQEKLPNGLEVTIVPKKDFQKTYAIFTTNYGSIDNKFVPLGSKEMIRVPDGIAHFLEHKLFEKEDGDVFQLFGKQGASANAFTSFKKTSYLFSSTENIMLNLATLIDFVQAPYFTTETVEKEKGIIAQEIQMYQDDANWRQFFGIISNLYPNHPLSIDIAGTVESIKEITAEDLHTCYNTFYHPSNMNLVVVGNVSVTETIELIRENQSAKNFAKAEKIQRSFPENSLEDIVPLSEIEMPVSRSKVSVGLKIIPKHFHSNREKVAYQMAGNLLCQLLFGDTSSHRQEMYDAGLIDDSFGYEFSIDREFSFADFGGDSLEPKALAEKVTAVLLDAANDPNLTEEHLDLLKRKMTGKFFQSLNSLEFIANKFSQQSFSDVTVFDTSTIISEITLNQLKKMAKDIFKVSAMSEFYIHPKN